MDQSINLWFEMNINSTNNDFYSIPVIHAWVLSLIKNKLLVFVISKKSSYFSLKYKINVLVNQIVFTSHCMWVY